MKKRIWVIIAIVVIMIYVQEPKKTGVVDNYGQWVSAYTVSGTSLSNFAEGSNIWLKDNHGYFTMLVRNAAFMSLENEDNFWDHIDHVETYGVFDVDVPAELPGDEYVYLNQEEWEQIQSAKIAHLFWMELHNIVPWSIDSFSDEELDTFYTKKSICSSLTPCMFYGVVDHNPTEAYEYAVQHIATTRIETTYNIIDDMRSDFRHGSAQLGDPTDQAFTLKHILETYYNGKRVSLEGCQSMCKIVADLARSLNIPAHTDYGWYDGAGHCSTFIPGVGILNHADDIYSGGLRDTPTPQLLMPYSYFEENIEPCGKGSDCAAYWTRRYNALNVVAYTPNSVKERMCDPPTYGYENIQDYLTSGVGVWGYLEEDELQAFIDEVLSGC